MTNKIKYSVIISAYNEKRKIETTINSINNYALLRKDIEIIVIDDASIDHTALTVSCLENVKLISNEERKGISVCRNIGIKKAMGDFVVFLDAHVRLENDIFSIYDSYFATYPKLDGISGAYYSILKKDSNTIRDVVRSAYRRKDEQEFFITSDSFTTISSCVFCVRKRVIDKHLFPTNFNGMAAEDTLVQLLLMKSGHNIMHSGKVRIVHDAELSYFGLLKKIKYQCQGTHKLLVVAVKNKVKKIPFLPFYLDFPLLTFITFYLTLPFVILGKHYCYLFLLVVALIIDFFALVELIGLIKFSKVTRIKAAVYILLNETIKIFDWPSSIIRERYSINNFIDVINIFLRWELRKIYHYFWRKTCKKLILVTLHISKCFCFQKD